METSQECEISKPVVFVKTRTEIPSHLAVGREVYVLDEDQTYFRTYAGWQKYLPLAPETRIRRLESLVWRLMEKLEMHEA